MNKFLNLYKRLNWYALVGVSTFILDLLLVRLFTGNGVSEYYAIVTSFLIAVSVNFTISYFLVFSGTDRSIGKGYVFFIGIALIGIVIIGPVTLWLRDVLDLNLYVARTIVGGTIGLINFLLNNFFNFKMGLR